MKRNVLFIQGAGEGAYREDEELAEALGSSLGSAYEVRYPEMPDEANAPYELWKRRIQEEMAALEGETNLVGHSIGASIVAKSLTQIEIPNSVVAVFLLGGPFWGGSGWRYEGYEELELPKNAATRLPQELPIFLYHCRDDEIVPFDHLALYAEALPQATVREEVQGGHQFRSALSGVTEDIRGL